MAGIDMNPVGQIEIADRACVKPDTVKKWRERDEHFPKPRWTVGGNPAWNWDDVLKWLRSTGRAPTYFRYRDLGDMILEESLDGDNNWVATAKFVSHGYDGEWSAYPCDALNDLGADEARKVAYEHLEAWQKVRQAWVGKHPDEPMPLHLVGVFRYGEDSLPRTQFRLDQLD